MSVETLSLSTILFGNNKRPGNISKGGVSGYRNLQVGKSTIKPENIEEYKKKGRRNIAKEEANDRGLIP